MEAGTPSAEGARIEVPKVPRGVGVVTVGRGSPPRLITNPNPIPNPNPNPYPDATSADPLFTRAR